MIWRSNLPLTLFRHLTSLLSNSTSIDPLTPDMPLGQALDQIHRYFWPRIHDDTPQYTCTLHDDRFPEYHDAPPVRLSFGHGSALCGYPSTGGIWILSNPHPVLLQHLGVDRFTETTSQRDTDPVAEDVFCISLRRIGATWWKSSISGLESQSLGLPEPDKMFTGWPKSGRVWVLRMEEAELWESKVGMLGMAVNMGEYCGVLEMCGAVFFEDAGECEDLRGRVLGEVEGGEFKEEFLCKEPRR